jgi:hypothetical protein
MRLSWNTSYHGVKMATGGYLFDGNGADISQEPIIGCDTETGVVDYMTVDRYWTEQHVPPLRYEVVKPDAVVDVPHG